MVVSKGVFLLLIAFVFFGTNVYISCRMYQCLHLFFRNLNILWFGMFCAVLVVLAFLSVARSHLNLNPSAKYALGFFGGYWMNVYVYLLLSLLAADLLLLIARTVRIMTHPVTGTVRCVSGIAAIAVTAIIIIGGTVHADRFAHRTYEVPMDKISDGREWNIVLISDLHIGAVRSEKRLERLVDEINALQPDIVCIAGDLFDNDFSAIRDPGKCARTLSGINAEYGVFACLGNHDSGKTVREMVEFLPQCGITLLDENFSVVDGCLILAGRLDGSPIGSYEGKKRGAFGDMISGADEDLPLIVLDHTPSHIYEYPDWVDLILCGHTHRGQIFPGSLFTKRLFPVDYGFFRENETSPAVIVTSGAGTWGMPVRVGTDSEIVSVKLTGK